MPDFPIPAQFPAPLALPSPQPNPYAGLSLVDRPLLSSGILPIGQVPTLYGPHVSSGEWAAANQLNIYGSITGGAVSAENDPRQWTPSEAAAQTDRALARIAQVNPELAAQLQQQRAGEAGVNDGGGGFWDGLKSVVATISGLPVIHQALDLLSRPAHIIPELLADDEHQGFFGNIAQALAGHSDKTMADFLEKRGIKNPVLRGILGFGLDVLVDPLTYVGGGFLGLGRGAVQSGGGRVIFEASVRTSEKGLATIDRLAEAAGVVGKTLEETRTLAFNRLWADVTGKGVRFFEHGSDRLFTDLGEGLHAVNADAVGGVLADFFRAGDTEILNAAVGAADMGMRAIGTSGLRNLGPRTAELLGLPQEEIAKVLEATRRAGIGGSRAAYHQAKVAAALQGGLHFRIAVPWTKLRYISPSLAPVFFGEGPFQGMRRFFAGLSGETRLRKMVEAGDANIEDLLRFWEPGFAEGGRKIGAFEALRRANPALADKLGKGALHLGSALYSASSQVGKITAGFGNGFTWHLLRGGGLGEYIASTNRKTTKSMLLSIEDDVWTLTHASNDATDAVLRDVKAAGLLNEKRNALLPRETQTILHDLYHEVDDPESIRALVSFFPDDAAAALGVDGWYAQIKAHYETAARDGLISQGELLEMLGREEALWREAKRAEAKLAGNAAKDKAYLGMRIQRTVLEQGREAADRYGIPLGDVRTPLANRTVISPDQAAEATAGAHAVYKDTKYNPTAETLGRTVPGEAGLHSPELITGATEDSPFRGIDLVEDRFGPAIEGEVRRQAVVTAHAPLLVLDEATLKAHPELLPLAEGNLVFDRINEQAEAMLDLISGEAGAATEAVIERAAKKFEKQKVRALLTPEGRAALAELGFSPEDLTPDMADILLSPTTGAAARAEKKAQLLTLLAQSEGYDAYMTVRSTADGGYERVTTVFHPDKALDAEAAKQLAPIKELAVGAPISQRLHGYVPFDVTDDVRALASPALSPEEIRLLGPRAKFYRGEARDALKDKTLAEAENIVREQLLDKGIVLPDGTKIIETDPLKLTSDYARQVSKRVAQAHTGEAGAWLSTLGLTRNPLVGGAVGVNQWDAVFARGDKRLADQLARHGANAYQFADRAARIMAVDVVRLRSHLATLSRRLDDATRRFSADMTEIQEIIEHSTNQTELLVKPRQLQRLQLMLNAPEKYKDIIIGPIKDVAPGVKKMRTRSLLNGEESEVYLALTPDGTVVGHRTVDGATGEVLIGTHPDYAKGGKFEGGHYGSRLIDAHWADKGVKTKAQIIREIKKQQFTEAGAGLNLSAARRNLPSARARQQAEDAVHAAENSIDAKFAEAREAAQAAERTIAEMKTRVADVRPAIVGVDENWAGMLPVNIFGVEKMKMPGFMALEMQRALQSFKTVNDLQKHWRRMLSWWKDWATWAFPGFHVRNNYGSLFNNWIGGVTLQDYVMSGRVRKAAWEKAHIAEAEWKWAGKEVPREFLEEHGLTSYFGHGRPVYYEDVATLTSNLGLNSAHGRAFAEARIGVEKLDEAVRGVRVIEKAGGPAGRLYIKGMRGAGTMTENVHRTAAFFKGLRDSRGELGGARLFAMMRHGDYQDLSDWEYGAVRDLIPFYKWTRTNLPFQIHTLIENPAKLLNVLKAKDAAWEAAGLDFGEDQYRVPEWYRQGFSLPLPGSSKDALELMLLDLPMNDLYMGAHEMLSSALPLARPILESYVFGKSLFSGKELTSKAVPASNVWPLNTAFNLTGHVLAPLGIGTFNEDGQYTIDEKLQNALSVLPMFGRFRNWIYADPSRTGLRAASLYSSILGVGVRPIGEAEMASNELSFYYQEVLPVLQQMESLGITLPTTDDVEHLYGTYQNAMIAAGLNPIAPTYAS